MPKSILLRAVLCLLMVAGVAVAAPAVAAGAPAMPNPSWTGEQVRVVASQQLPDGAILFKPDEIEPYFANLAAIGLARSRADGSATVLLQWMKWYMSHLNRSQGSSQDELPGSIDDYRFDSSSGVETSMGTMDSVDSYAATALSLANATYLTGNRGLRLFVKSHLADYELMARILIAPAPEGVLQPDELDIALPSYPVEFTMDNAEVYRGLQDFASLEAAVGRIAQASNYSQWASRIRAAMLSNMWDAQQGIWDWYTGVSTPASTYYPGSTAQMWPILNGVVSPSSTYAKKGWQAFVTAWPQWSKDQIGDTFPDVYIARAAELMGDNEGARTFLNTVHSRFAPTWAWPWFDEEAGWFIQANVALR